MRAAGGFHEAACAFEGGSGNGNHECEDEVSSRAAGLQQHHLLRAASSTSRSSIAALQHFLQAAGSVVGLPSAYRGGNVINLSRCRGRSRTCGGVVQKEAAAADAQGESAGAAPGHTSEENYGGPEVAAADRLRWVHFGGMQEEEAAGASRHVYGSGEELSVERRHYWSAARPPGGEEACVSLHRISDASQKRFGDCGEREALEGGKRGVRGALFNAVGPAAVGLGLTEYASGQLTMSLDAVTGGGGYAGGSYAAGLAAAAAAAAGGGGGGPGIGTATAAGHFSGCCPHSGTGVSHPGSSCWAPRSDFFGKAEYAAVPEVQTSVSAAQSSSQPSGGGFWGSSRAAVAAAAAATCAEGGGVRPSRGGAAAGAEEEDEDREEDEEELPLSEKGTPLAASRYPAAAQLRREQQMGQRRQRLAAGRLSHTRGGKGRAPFRRHSAVSYYTGIFAAAAAQAAADASVCGDEGRCFRSAALHPPHSAPDGVAYVQRAHSAAAAAPQQCPAAASQQSPAAGTLLPHCLRGAAAGAAEAARLQRQADDRLRPLSLTASPQEEAHQSAEIQQPLHDVMLKEQVLLHQRAAREQLLQQQRVHEHQVMLQQQQLATERERQQQQQQKPNAGLLEQQLLQQQARDYQMQQHATVDFWKSTVGTPSGACLALRSQKHQLLLLHEQLLRHSKRASAQQQQSSTRGCRGKAIRRRERRNSCCDCRPYGSCGRCRDRVPRLPEEGEQEQEEEGEEGEEDIEEEDEEVATAAAADHNALWAQQQVLLHRSCRRVLLRECLGAGSTADGEREEEEEGQSPAAAAAEEESEEEEEDAAATAAQPRGEEAAAARAAGAYHSSATALEGAAGGREFLSQQQQAFPLRNERRGEVVEGNKEPADARLFASPFKLGHMRRRPSDAAARAAAAVAAAASSFSLPARPCSGFPTHSSPYASFAAAAAAPGSSSSRRFVSLHHLRTSEVDEGGGQEAALDAVSAQELGNSLQQSCTPRNCGRHQPSKHEQPYRANVSPSRGVLADALSRKLFAGADGGRGSGRAATASCEGAGGTGVCADAAAAVPLGGAPWHCSNSELPPSSAHLSTAAAPASAAAQRGAPTAAAAAVSGPPAPTAAESSSSSRKSALWAPSSLLKTLTRGLQQHAAGPSSAGRRSSSTLVSTTAAAAPLSGFCSSSSCTRRLSVLSSNGAAFAGSAACAAGSLEDTAGSSSSSGGGAAAALQRETKPPPPPPPPRAAAAAPLTRSYSASLYRGAAPTSTQTCSTSSKPQQSGSGSGGYSSFSSLARVLRPRRHSHHQGEGGRRAAAAAAPTPVRQRQKEVRDSRREDAAASAAAERVEGGPEREQAAADVDAAAREPITAAAGESAAAPSITSAYIGEEESSRLPREGEAAPASPSSRRAGVVGLRARAAAAAEGTSARAAAAAAFLGVAAMPCTGRYPPRLLRDAAVRIAGSTRHLEVRRQQRRGGAAGDASNGRQEEEGETQTAAAGAAASGAAGASQRAAEQQQGTWGEPQQQEHSPTLLHRGAAAAAHVDPQQQASPPSSPNLPKNARRSHTAPSRAGLGSGRKAAAVEAALPATERPPRVPSAADALAASPAAVPYNNTAAAGGAGVAASEEEMEAAAVAAAGGKGAAADFSMEGTPEKVLPALLHQQQQLADVACGLQQLKTAPKALVGSGLQQEHVGEKERDIVAEAAGRAAESYGAAGAARVGSGRVSQAFRQQAVPAQGEEQEQQRLLLPSRPSQQQQQRQLVLQEQGQLAQETVFVQKPPHAAAAQQQQLATQQQQQQKPEGRRPEKVAESSNKEPSVHYDIQFGRMLVRLHRKLSSKCHCQFDVWEGEAVGFVEQQQQQPETGDDEEDAAAVASACGCPDGVGTAQQNGGSLLGGSSSSDNGGGNIAGEREKGRRGAGAAAAATAATGGRENGGHGSKGSCKGAAGNIKEFEDAAFVVEDMSSLPALHTSIVGLGRRFAIKVLEIDNCESAKLKYKTHSVLQEGKQLRDLCVQLRRSGAAAAIQSLSTCPSSNTVKLAQQRLLLLQLQHEPRPLKHPEVYVQQLDPRAAPLPLLPIPRYFWTGWGVKREDGSRILGVSMEKIEGQPLTQILQQMRVPTKKSAALLTLEISIKFVRAQAVLSSRAALDKPIINWDTKPGNVLVELQRSASSQQLHCLRCVIIDLGDALPGPTYFFPTRHQAGVTPSYVICTKGYCSPECAILVFMLSAVSKSSAFRKVWYGTDISAQAMLAARKERFEKRWQAWVQQGYLRKICLPRPSPSAVSSASGASQLGFAGAVTFSAEKSACVTPGAGSAGKKAPPAAPAGSGNGRRDDEGAEGRGAGQATRDSAGAQKGQQGNSGGGSSAGNHSNSGYWEVLLSDRSVVFSTGLIIGQLFGGPSLLQVVNRDEVAALDILCEWGCTSAPNLLLHRENLHSEALLPTQGVFAAEPWRDRVKTMLQHTLAFLPGERWSFQELENFLLKLHADLAATPDITPVEAPPRESAANSSTRSNNHSWGLHHRHSPPGLVADTHNHLQRNLSSRRPDYQQAAAAPV